MKMTKHEALELLGGSAESAAREIGVTHQAIYAWPDVLTDAIRDRVQAALYRRAAFQDKLAKAQDRTAQPATDSVAQGAS